MEFLLIGIICLLLIIILGIVYGINIKKLKEMTNIKELDEIANKYPNNINICKEYLKKLNNRSVNIQEEPNSNTTVYIATSNKIFIGNLRKSYTRMQTIAHECLHSVQKKKILLFNFIFSNIYLLYFLIIVIFAMLKKLPYEMAFLSGLSILGLIYYSIRMYLENDAMIKARYLSKEYMEEKGISTKEEIKQLINQYDIVNDIGIRSVNYQMLAGVLLKIAIFAFIAML